MTDRYDYENGELALATLVTWLAARGDLSGENEMTARFHLIDKLITDVLQWPRDCVEVERHHEGGYTDYELGCNAKVMVIEAKRASVSFDLPAGWNRPTAPISLLSKHGGVGKAIEQSIGYAQERGIPIAAICNGPQLIATIASRQDGVAPLEGRALVFKSLDDMQARFRELWDALSPPGVRSDTLSQLLKAQEERRLPPKLSHSLLEYPGYKNRNPIAAELQILGGLFIDDLAQQENFEELFLQHAYCQSGALSQYSLVSKEILRTRYSRSLEQEGGVSAVPVTTKKGLAPELETDLLAAAMSQRPILLVGDVGAGKTTFIRHLWKVEAKVELERALVFYIDFGSEPALTQELERYVHAAVEKQLRETYGIDTTNRDFVRGVYHGRLAGFSTGIYSDLKELDPTAYRLKEIEFLEGLLSDKEGHLKACLEHASKGQKRQIVVFLDNVDQRPQAFQEQVFLIANALAKNWPVTAFVALRPETFVASKRDGSLSGYQPRVFTINPPRVDQVIVRRLIFARSLLKQHGSLLSLPAGLTVQSDTMDAYLDMLLDTFQNGQAVIEFVDNMSNGNVRRPLEFINAFVGSAHVDARKILSIIEKSGRYHLQLHEFLRAVAHGDHEYYYPETSSLINVFDVSTYDEREHFLALLLLARAHSAGSLGAAEGYVATAKLAREAQACGFTPTQLEVAIERLVKKELLEAPAGHTPATSHKLRITSAGAYTVRKLASTFTYIDAMIVDTPILSEPDRALILDSRAIRERLDRASKFLDYLDAAWHKFTTSPQDLPWANMAKTVRDEIARIRGGLGHQH